MKARLTAVAYALGWSALCRVPESWAAAMFRLIADIAWRRQGKGVQVLEGNLLRVLGEDATGAELRALSLEAMRSYARYWLEIFRLPIMSKDLLVKETHEVGHVEDLLANLAAGRGVVIPLPHMGNWDAAAVWVIGRGAGSFTTVMERLEPESVYERFLAFRQSLGMEVLPASGGASPFGVLAQRLRHGKLVALPSDRDVTGGGVEVEFFGESALMMGGSAALAVQTGAALMPATVWFEDGRWGVEIHKEIPVPAEGDRWHKAAVMTQEVARAFERGIREHPADWHMLQRVFVSDLDPDRLAAARAKVAARQRAAQRGAAQHAERDGQAAGAREAQAKETEAEDAKETAAGAGGAS
ncbi:MAG TPA: phosphatidylinositol mannoside acyltransferase [Streptosporangiaceae bacterium]|nr:phosphatidylinositol mannoside acyltransferase [Streptosporangiaceae bacterium]